jgi:hypothetical protein
MSIEDNEIVEIGDKTALICADGPLANDLKTTLQELGFKCHTAEAADRAIERMKYTAYDVIAVAENFAGSTLETNGVIQYLAPLPIAQRRNSYVVAVGDSFRTLDAMQAYANSIHLVVNPTDVPNLGAILKKGFADFELFSRVYGSVLAETGEIA